MWLGWCPGGRTTKTMLDTYQGTTAVRIFVGAGKPMPTWDGPVLGPLVAAGVPVVHLSVKDRDWAAVRRLVDGKPAGMLLILTFGHEPEQGPSEGDLPIDEWKQAWADLVPLLADHPARAELLLVPVYTRYWWEKNRGDMRWLLDVPVDAIGWDIYNNGAGYRSPDDLLTIPRQIAEQTGLPYLVGELGALPLAVDKDGSGRDAWMRAMVDAIRADGALTCCWFHKDGWDLMAAGSEPAQRTWQTLLREEPPMATTAPPNLIAVRNLLLTYLNVDKASVRVNDLEPAEVGIVGDPAHRGGYHCGSDRVVGGDYSVVESSRDRTGLDRWACALDVGTFKVTTRKGAFDLPHYSRWLVAQCEANTADTRDIREVIYSPDGRTVKRWDRLGKRTSGDNSHLYHTHKSYFRDAIKAGRDQTAVVLRYLTEIGLIEGDDDMDQATFDKLLKGALTGTGPDAKAVQAQVRALPWAYPVTSTSSALNVLFGQQLPQIVTALKGLAELVARESASPEEVKALLDKLPKTDPQQIVAGVLAGLPAEKIAAAIPPQIAQDVADELSRRLTS